ncbi:MAG: response regulator transcription factor [Elusimicrobia bacterium]|nr:response regulator transcription factor [Elusimicrobiota bacterium]
MTIKILLVDVLALVREGLRLLLEGEKNIEIAGAASDGAEALALVRKLHPDVVLMDLSMPRMNGFEATRRILKVSPRAKVLALTMHSEQEYVSQIVRSGAIGYVLKDTSRAKLVRAIAAAAHGKAFFSAKVSRNLLNDFVKTKGRISGRPLTELSAREEEVLVLIAQGLSNKEIAQRIRLKRRTVETYRERLMQKLGIHNAVGLTKYAIARGLVDVPSAEIGQLFLNKP